MFFQKKENDLDLDSLKKAIESEHGCKSNGSNDDKIPEINVPIQRPMEDDSAPLFVKVSKYNEILTNLQEMKAFMAGVKQVYHILSEVETIRNETLELLRTTIQRVERNIIQLDSGLLRPMGSPQLDVRSEQATHVENSLTDLEQQLESLKRELEKFKWF